MYRFQESALAAVIVLGVIVRSGDPYRHLWVLVTIEPGECCSVHSGSIISLSSSKVQGPKVNPDLKRKASSQNAHDTLCTLKIVTDPIMGRILPEPCSGHFSMTI